MVLIPLVTDQKLMNQCAMMIAYLFQEERMFPKIFGKSKKYLITLPRILRSCFVLFYSLYLVLVFHKQHKTEILPFSLRSCTRSIDDKVWKTESISTSIDEFGNRKNTCEVTAIELLSTKVLLNNSVIFLLNKATKKNV